MSNIKAVRAAQMNWNLEERDWRKLESMARSRWNKLADDHLDVIADRREHMIGKLQEVYGVDRIDAESEVIAFEMQHDNHRVPQGTMRASTIHQTINDHYQE
ncbi:MAG: general stress protein CsbD [Steroidobacter sp.]